MKFDIDLLYQLVGKKIKAGRKKKKLSQEKLALALDRNRVSIVNIESGGQHAPLHILWRIAEILEVELDQIIPSPSELEQAGSSDELTDDEIRMIEAAAAGNPAARRQLRNVIQNGKKQTKDKG